MKTLLPAHSCARTSLKARHGNVFAWTFCCMTVIAGFTALAVDFGRAMAVKSELQTATDAAARYAARTMRSQSGDTSAAAASASAVFAESKIDGGAVTFTPSTDLEIGIWNEATMSFTVATIAGGANAIRLSTRVVLGDAARPLAVVPLFRGPITVRAQCVAMVSGESASTYVSAMSNPWLSGMSSGTMTQNLRPDASHVWDYAGSGPNVASSPGMINLASENILAGQTILFDNVTGTANNTGGGGVYTADGNTGWVVSLGTADASNSYNWSQSVNGVSNIKAPINGMVAVFLNDNAPNSTAAPANLDFSSSTSRDYTSIAPELKQVFFVGDGRRSNGEAQQIVIPAGATRVFIGNMDAWQWNDNSGGYTATINSVTKVVTVK